MHGGIDRRTAIGLSAAGIVGVALGAHSAPAHAQPPVLPPGPPDRVMIIRHAEDPFQPGEPFGITAGGMHDSKRSLIVRGWTRAGALVPLFDPRDPDGNRRPTHPELARPTQIFAHNPGEADSKRSFETVTPLAAALGLEVNVSFDAHQTAELAAALSTLRGSALVAWKHEHIAEIVSHFIGVEPVPPRKWPGRRFDMVYVLTRNGGGWRFTQVPQMLLAGDVNTPIAAV